MATISQDAANAIIDKFHEISHPDYAVDFDWSMDELTSFINSLVGSDKSLTEAMREHDQNDCYHLMSRYPEGTRIPAANEPNKMIAVAGLQRCALNWRNQRYYSCPFTKSGAVENCGDYISINDI